MTYIFCELGQNSMRMETPKVNEEKQEAAVAPQAQQTVRAEKEGVRSESYLLVYDERGALVQKKLLRRDSYAAVQGIYEVKITDFIAQRGDEIP